MKKTTTTLLAAAIALPCAANSPFITHIHDFVPAPGQFVNSVPEVTQGMSREQVLDEVARQLVGDERPGMVSLGAFGGYVVFSFDHPVVNVPGEYDFRIYGNAFKAANASDGGSSEPGIVMVSEDTNGDGIPNDEWFELKGSEWGKKGVIDNFTITYKRPSQLDSAEDISWTSDNEERRSGTVDANEFHRQTYWPLWLADAGELTFTGTCLPDNAYDQSGDGTYWVLRFYGEGYVDCLPDFVQNAEMDMVPNPENPGFNLDNAVDGDGNRVELKQIHFIKVYTAINQKCGWLGETSTEVCGARDLHPDAEIPNVGIDFVITDSDTPVEYYSLQGVRVANPQPGDIVICRRGASATKLIIR